MKKGCIVGLSLLFLFVALLSFAEYDRDLVVKSMRSNGKLFGEARKAAEAKDFFMTAEKLMEIAKGFKGLDAVTPTKGSKGDWDAIHGSLIKAAFIGIGACGEEDVNKLNASIKEIGGLIQKGHQMFRG